MRVIFFSFIHTYKWIKQGSIKNAVMDEADLN